MVCHYGSFEELYSEEEKIHLSNCSYSSVSIFCKSIPSFLSWSSWFNAYIESNHLWDPIYNNLCIKQTYWWHYIWNRFLDDSKEHPQRQRSKKLSDYLWIWLPSIVHIKSSDSSNFYLLSAFRTRNDLLCRFIFVPCTSWNLFFSYFNLSGCKLETTDQTSRHKRIKIVGQHWVSSDGGGDKKEGTSYSQNKQDRSGRN